MPSINEQFVRDVMSGTARGPLPTALRLLSAIASPFYSLAMRLRNKLFDSGLKKQVKLPRPVISVGNITTGGTGKTPLVQWLIARMQLAGQTPAVLMRGYKADAAGMSDEAALLSAGAPAGVLVAAHPDRVASAMQLLERHPTITHFILDDGFQHRRVRRDLNLVLIDATEPFGFNRVLPRGLLREPLSGLRRADLVLLTRSDLVAETIRAEIVARLSHFTQARVLQCAHRITHLTNASGQSFATDILRGQRIFIFCGIGNPQSFQRQLTALGAIDAGSNFFADHHPYSADDVSELLQQASANHASFLITTEKDWVKIAPLSFQDGGIPILRAVLELEFTGNGEAELAEMVEVLSKR